MEPLHTRPATCSVCVLTLGGRRDARRAAARSSGVFTRSSRIGSKTGPPLVGQLVRPLGTLLPQLAQAMLLLPPRATAWARRSALAALPLALVYAARRTAASSKLCMFARWRGKGQGANGSGIAPASRRGTVAAMAQRRAASVGVGTPPPHSARIGPPTARGAPSWGASPRASAPQPPPPSLPGEADGSRSR
jgi:hypothetical protein